MTTVDEKKLNLAQIFLHKQKKYQDRVALRYPDAAGVYSSITWNEWSQSVQQTAAGLQSLGVERGDRVAILSENRPEWTYIDLACLGLGAALVPIYPTSSYQDTLYILKNAEVKVFFVSSQEHYERLKSVGSEDIALEKIVVIDEIENFRDESTLNFQQLIKKEIVGFNFEKEANQVQPDDLATLIYTSGTTGPPKGVMLTHKNFVANYLSAKEVISVNESDVSISFLPLSHVFERLAGYYFMAFCGATIAYARSMQTVPEDIQVVKPTVAAAVPRFYEKVHTKILEKVEASSSLVRKLFSWSVRVGCEVAQKRIEKVAISPKLAFQYKLAKLISFNKLKKKLGGRIRFFISGGAPLSKALAEFFYAADVLILEGYGLTETSPVIAVNTEDDPHFGVVGRPLSVAEVRIAEDGEILTRGDCVMKGYYKNEEATRAVIDDEKWFHTGDIGEITEKGFLKITDRKKDIIVTSGGKNIPPQNLENDILTETLISQIVVIGDKRNYLVALIVPNEQELCASAEKLGIENKDYAEMLKHPEIYDLVDKRLQEKLKGRPSYEQIKYFTLLAQELTQEAGELTPTLKVKRKFVTEKYSLLIEGMYQKGKDYQPSKA